MPGRTQLITISITAQLKTAELNEGSDDGAIVSGSGECGAAKM